MFRTSAAGHRRFQGGRSINRGVDPVIPWSGRAGYAPAPPVAEMTSREPDVLQRMHERERRQVLESILARMSEKRRTTFVLFEIEGYSGEEIAQIQSLPLKTVWTRLHHARKDFMRMVSSLPAEGE